LPTPKYGNIAITRLIEKMESLGAQSRRLQAKVFGGAAMWMATEGLLAVGARNIELADAMLQELSIPVIGKDVGGVQSRKIIYNTADGSVLLRRHSTLAGGKRPGEP
jgi:chemotaxis protein CheD